MKTIKLNTCIQLRAILIVALLNNLFLVSCFKEEETMELPPLKGNIGVAAMTETYKYQIYYHLETNSAVKTNRNTDWDLGFACADTTWHIVLNNARMMLAGNSETTIFEDVTSHDGIEMCFDQSGGNTDSVAINDWLRITNQNKEATGYVYVIDRGTGEDNTHLGYKKIKMSAPENNSYKMTFSNLDGTNKQTVTIEKIPEKNYTCFSFENGIMDIEPAKNKWTLLFTSYQTILYDSDGNAVPYLVRGALLNPHQTTAALDTVTDFYRIGIKDTSFFQFSDKHNIIGYDWKFYDFDNGTYSVVEGRNYIIKNCNNHFYKLRFFAFYNDENRKGYPTFEFMLLN